MGHQVDLEQHDVHDYLQVLDRVEQLGQAEAQEWIQCDNKRATSQNCRCSCATDLLGSSVIWLLLP